MSKDMTTDVSIADRKVIYRARRGLKELDYYFDPYVKHHYLNADAIEKATFARMVELEDPDLLDWFMDTAQPDDKELAVLILKMKQLKSQ